MKAISFYLCLIILITPTILWAADDCLFDEENQKLVISTIATMHPKGKIDLENHTITWKLAKEGTTTFAYGGCQHSGSTITNTKKLPQQRTTMQAFDLVKILINRFWNNDYVSAQSTITVLSNAIKSATFSIEKFDGKTLYRMNDPDSEKLIIIHEYKNGLDHMEISWQGND